MLVVLLFCYICQIVPLCVSQYCFTWNLNAVISDGPFAFVTALGRQTKINKKLKTLIVYHLNSVQRTIYRGADVCHAETHNDCLLRFWLCWFGWCDRWTLPATRQNKQMSTVMSVRFADSAQKKQLKDFVQEWGRRVADLWVSFVFDRCK